MTELCQAYSGQKLAATLKTASAVRAEVMAGGSHHEAVVVVTERR